MRTVFYYTPPIPTSESQPIQWIAQPSFYNGYATNIPMIRNQPMPMVQSNFPPTVDQNPVNYPSPSIISSTDPSSVKANNRFRNPFSSSTQQRTDDSDSDFLHHERQLNQNLASHRIERLPVKGDGNCLFYALAEGLMHEIKNDPHGFGSSLTRICHLPMHFRLVDLANSLRQLCVEQWRLHEDYYSQFVDKEKVTFHKEVKKFSKNGVSDSTLGDIVPLTIANALNVHITIFTSVSNLPRIDVKPEYRINPLSMARQTIYLAYNQYGMGHYDAAYPHA